MWFPTFLASWTSGFSRRRRPQPRPARRSLRPTLEQLESRLTPSFSTLAEFSVTSGYDPQGTQLIDSSGNLYGTTMYGGASGEGTVYELAQGSGTITPLASFNGTNGQNAQGGLVIDSSGNLYGTTTGGGASGDGTVFELAKGSGTITTLASFTGANGSDPAPGLAMDSSGNLYGTTTNGGASGDGTVFELAKGSGTITTLASFNGANGASPHAGPIMDSSGNLYGTTSSGGDLNSGTVYELAQGSGTITPLAWFDGGEGENGYSGLTLNSVNGNLFGTTAYGGACGEGTVFKVVKGQFGITTLASFGDLDGQDWVLGEDPVGSLVRASNGLLYGTTEYGGPSATTNSQGDGTVFEMSSLQGGGFETLMSFGAGDGAFPNSGLVMDSSGNLYGTTSGSIFELTLSPAPQPSFAVTGFPKSTTAGVAQTITVTALNANGTVDTGYSGTVHFSSSDPKAVLPANSTLTNGVGTFQVTLETAGTQSITVTDTATSSETGSETNITVNPAAAAQFVLSAPSSVASGAKFSPTLTVEDAYGNVATGYTGTVHFTSSDSTATLPANYTYSGPRKLDSRLSYCSAVLERG